LRWQKRTSASGWPRASATNKEIYLRFAVSINERLNSGVDQIMAPVRLRGNSPTRLADGKRLPERPAAPQPKQLDEIEQMIAEAATEGAG
jgi:hypothetical protein